MPKQPKGRMAEQRYAKRVRSLSAGRKKRTKGRTPWKQFFDSGTGATMKTEIPRSSIHSIVYTYGKKLGKKFNCSFEEKDGLTTIRIESITRR